MYCICKIAKCNSHFLCISLYVNEFWYLTKYQLLAAYLRFLYRKHFNLSNIKKCSMHDDALRVIEDRLQFCTHALRWICPLSSYIMCRTFSHFGWALGNGYIFVSNFQGSDSIYYYSHYFSSLRSTRLCKGFDYRMKQKSILLRVIHREEKSLEEESGFSSFNIYCHRLFWAC